MLGLPSVTVHGDAFVCCKLMSLLADQNECTDFESSPCGTWRCENTIGSYRCFQGCQPGVHRDDAIDCGELVNLNKLMLALTTVAKSFW